VTDVVDVKRMPFGPSEPLPAVVGGSVGEY
jgi:hypothetical protein